MSKDEMLDEIFEKADDVASVTENNDESVEFNFKGGLIFENMAIPENKDEEPSEDEVAEEATDEEEDDEFTLPDTFKIDEKYNTPETPDTPTTIFRTYVPKFTDVSETYRMINDPRPRPKVEPKAEDTKKEVSDGEKIDPLSELEISHDEAVTVKVKGKEERDPESLNVFKFPDPDAKIDAGPRERTVEDERREIDKLISSDKNPMPEPVPVAEPELVAEPEPQPVEDKKDPRSYTIPDPTEDIKVVDYEKAGRDTRKYKRVEPDGVTNEPPKTKKRKLGAAEFNSQAERDEFKDAFLDSTLSIKIRLVIMTVLALATLAYENYFASRLGNFGINPGMYAVIDLIFVGVMFFIASPEVGRAIKYLTFGRVIPELYLIPALIVEAIYAVAITTDVGEHPLYGMIFGIFAISAVASAHYRVNADFTAFKVISRNTEKQIIDKKLTRTLTDENLALDGVVDEYKSRTSRIFRAAFISDFFKRIGKVSENTLATLIPIFVSFGVAVVFGLVIFFLKGGVNGGTIPAISGFTLISLLSLPAFSILTRKIPYYDAQLAALDEESTLVGETSYSSFSGVDVMAFEDTDIFGIDDVSLRTIMLYGEKNDMEKTMKQMNSLFAAVGGPLDLIFKKTIDRKCHPASDVAIETDGISGIVDGSRIYAGTEEYMLRHNIAIPEIGSNRDMGVDTTKIMYAAENGEIYVKFYVRYSFSEEFTMLLPSIKAEGIVPLIYTRDPNISNELLKTLSAGSDSMRVMKKYQPLDGEDEKIYRRVSAELVTYGDNINAINTILLTKRYKKFSQKIETTELYASGFAAVVAAVLALANVTAIPVIVYSIWQIAWCIALRIASKSAFPRASEKDSEN